MHHNAGIGSIIALATGLLFLFAVISSNDPDGGLCLAKPDECDKCGPTRMIGCRSGRCYYKCTRRCLGQDNKFYYEAVKFNFDGQ